jgi:hypothetical protein
VFFRLVRCVDEGVENLDWLERKRIKWLKSRKSRDASVSIGEACNLSACLVELDKVKEVGFLG